MKLLNLTPHDIVIWNTRMGDQEVVIPSSGEARVDSKLIRLDKITDDDTGVDVPLISFECDYAYGLPEPAEGVMIIVSKALRQAYPHRMDLASPDVTSSESVFVGKTLRSVPGLVVNSRRS